MWDSTSTLREKLPLQLKEAVLIKPWSPVCKAIALLVLLLTTPLRADEGFWTFDHPPLRQLAALGFTPTPAFLDQIRLASLLFPGAGGSGSFVSGDGLILTNHHIALDCLQSLSTPKSDLVARGFYAATRDKEAACPGIEANALLKIEDVTARVNKAPTASMSDREAAEARKAAIARIRAECHERSGLRCDVVNLYQGGEYDLYEYKSYTDVRLVFAPEQDTAYFGGDPDNYTYPRHDVDVCFFRAYENGQPVKPPAFIPFAKGGASDGELVLASGNPANSSRQHTLAQLTSEREIVLPAVLKFVNQRLTALKAYGARGPEQKRRALNETFEWENERKSFEGSLIALYDAKALAQKADEEKDLQARVAADPALAAATGNPWSQIAAAQGKLDARVDEQRFVGFHGSNLLETAGDIVRLTAEVQKPNEERLEEFVDSALPSFKNQLYSEAPLYDDLEEVTLSDQFQQALAALGPSHPFVRAALQGRTPAEAARAAIAGTGLKDPSVRKKLVDGGTNAVLASADSMIVLARAIEPLARAERRFRDEEVRAVTNSAGQKIAEARFRIYGRSNYPDATFNLRLSYGTLKGYPAEGTQVPPFTTFYGLFDRSLSFGGKPPWSLGARWTAKKGALDLATPLNFVCTVDIIGGSSGSPVLNTKGELVGLIFDGNIQGLAWDYFYTDEQARAVAVDVRAIVESLRKVYEAEALLKELGS
jgi:hypothetical protein